MIQSLEMLFFTEGLEVELFVSAILSFKTVNTRAKSLLFKPSQREEFVE